MISIENRHQVSAIRVYPSASLAVAESQLCEGDMVKLSRGQMAQPVLCWHGMYPLLAAGASAVAQNLVESLGGMMQRKLNPTGAPKFDTLLGAGGAAPSKAPTLEEQIAALRTKLLQAPELQTALNTGDPAKAGSLSISSLGAVTLTGMDGPSAPLSLSPETTALARSLGGLMSQTGGATSSGGYSLAQPRPTLNVYA